MLLLEERLSDIDWILELQIDKIYTFQELISIQCISQQIEIAFISNGNMYTAYFSQYAKMCYIQKGTCVIQIYI